MQRVLMLIAVLFALRSGTPVQAASPGCAQRPKVEVVCVKSSALLALNVTSCRKIGDVVIEVRDAAGRTVYKEEGKAMTAELVRRLDRGALPKGELTLLVNAKDLSFSQRVVNE